MEMVRVSGIRISRSATAVVHAEGPGGGDSATLCGKGADYIHGTDEAVTCKGCMKKMPLAELKANTDQILQTVARDRAASVEANRPKVKAHPVQIAGNVGSAYLVVKGHEAESHSRRGHECRICGQPVVDHESVNISDGVAVCWWTGTVVDPSAVLNPERVALVEARREAARTEEALLSDIEEWQTAHRDGRCDGLFIPDAYAHEVTVALWNAGRIVPGSKVAPDSNRLGWFSVRMIDADHAEALTMDARTEIAALPDAETQVEEILARLSDSVHRDAWHRLIDSLATGTERERSCAAMDAADRVLWPLGVPQHVFRPETWYAVAMEVYRASEPRWTTASKRKASKARKGR